MIDGPNVKVNDLGKKIITDHYSEYYEDLSHRFVMQKVPKSTIFFFLSSEHGTAVFLDMYVPRYYHLIPSLTVPLYCHSTVL